MGDLSSVGVFLSVGAGGGDTNWQHWLEGVSYHWLSRCLMTGIILHNWSDNPHQHNTDLLLVVSSPQLRRTRQSLFRPEAQPGEGSWLRRAHLLSQHQPDPLRAGLHFWKEFRTDNSSSFWINCFLFCSVFIWQFVWQTFIRLPLFLWEPLLILGDYFVVNAMSFSLQHWR